MWSSFVKLLEENYFYDLLAKLLPKIADSNRKKILAIKVNLFNGKYEECLDTLDEMLEKEPKNLDLLEMKADICFKLEKIFESEEVFLLILKQKPSSGQSYRAFLRLGYTYLSRKSW
jgi:predicted Zn-dependent protease